MGQWHVTKELMNIKHLDRDIELSTNLSRRVLSHYRIIED